MRTLSNRRLLTVWHYIYASVEFNDLFLITNLLGGVMNWDTLKSHQVDVYTTSWCPDCHRLKAVLDTIDLEVNYIDIDKHPEAAERLQAETGRSAIPYIAVDDRAFVRGWHTEAAGKWDESIFFAELEQALAK